MLGSAAARGAQLVPLHLCLGGLIVVALPTPSTAPAEPVTADGSVTVMTRNLYIGADIERAVNAAAAAHSAGTTPQEVLVSLANAIHLSRGVVDRTDFRVRAGLIADEVARAAPDLVGLQEVALWRSGPLQLDEVGVANATTVDLDYLRMLLDELAARGLDYSAAHVGVRADVEAPSFTGSPFDGTLAAERDVRLTVRDVILVRSAPSLVVTGSGDQVYAHNLRADVAGVEVGFERGFHWVDVQVGSRPLRFANTHLEAFSSGIALAQAGELLAAVPAPDRTTVLVCDANSDPLHAEPPAADGPVSAAYDLITGPGGFTDEWLRWAPADEGWTSGLSELVDDPTAAGFDRRLDMVFARTPTGEGLAVEDGRVTGTSPTDRDPATGLWPSDHGGVVLRLRGF